MSPPNDNPAPQPLVPDHELVRCIGKGSYGEVWLARNVLGTWRAVKIVFRRSFDSERPYEREFEGIRRFEPVSRSHEGFVDVLQIGRNDADGYFYYVMELADDLASETAFIRRDGLPGITDVAAIEPTSYAPKTLGAKALRGHRMNVEEAVHIGLELSSALEHLHNHGLVHRDIKPANIIFVRGQPKLADIGLVAAAGEVKSFVGTEGFTPPEGPGTPQSDIYSLGKVLYEISTGNDRLDFPKLPLGGAGSIERERFSELNEIILKACAHKAADRYEAASEMHAELALLQLGRSVRRLRLIERQFLRLKKIGAAAAILCAIAFVAYVAQLRQARRADAIAAEELKQRRIAENALTRAELERAEDLFNRGEVSLALASLAHVVRQNPTNEVASHRLLSALTHRNLPFPAAAPIQHSNTVMFAKFIAPPPRLRETNRFILDSCQRHVALSRFADHELQRNFTNSAVITAARVSGDNELLLVGGQDGVARLWSLWDTNAKPVEVHHAAAITHVAFSADGKTFSTSSADRTARVWNLKGEPLVPALAHRGLVGAAVFSPDGERIATVSNDETARIWNAKTGEPISPLLPHRDIVAFAAFSPDGELLVTTSLDGAAQLWNGRTGESLGVRFAHAKSVPHAAFSPDGRRIATASWDYTAQVWDVKTGARIGEPIRHDGYINSLEFSADGERLLTGSWDHTARIWAVRTSQPLCDPMRHAARVNTASFSSDGAFVITASDDGMTQIWDVRLGAAIPEMVTHDGWVRAVAFNAKGDRFATASQDSRARVWHTGKSTPVTPWLESSERITSVHFSPDGTRLLTTANDGRAQMWNVKTGELAFPVIRHGKLIYDAAFSPDGKLFATASGAARLWKTENGGAFGNLMQHESTVLKLAFSPDGSKLATASYDGSARVWDVATQRALTPPLRHKREVHYVSWSRDGRFIATASADYTAQIWNAATGERTTPPLRHEERVNSVEFSPDGRRVVTASDDRTARIWDAATGAPLTQPLRHGGEIFSAMFSPDGSRIATASADATARVWDTLTGLPLGEPFRHAQEVLCVAFHPNGKRLLTGSKDGSARMWTIGKIPVPLPAHLIALAESVAGQRFNSAKLSESVAATTLLTLREQVLADAKEQREWQWYYEDRGERETQPDGAVSVPQLVARCLDQSTDVCLDLAVEMQPTNGLAWAKIAKRGHIFGRQPLSTNDALWLAKHATQLAADDVRVWRLRGEVAAAAGDFNEARAACSVATKMQEDDPNLWRAYGEALARLRENGEARTALDRAVALLDTNDNADLDTVLRDRSRVLAELGELNLARADASRAMKLPARATNASPRLLDLTLAYNANLTNSWQDPRILANDLAEFPAGVFTCNGTLFDARGIVQLQSSHSPTRAFPTNVTMRVGQSAHTIHLLVGTGWTGTDGQRLATITVHRRNGSESSFPIRYGDEVLGWWREDDQRPAPRNARVAWRGWNGAVRPLGQSIELFHVECPNGKPDAEIEHIEFTSAMAYGAPFLLAVTLD